ncbi:MAG: recombinase family protein [Bifidobacteriaceae bacterium]|jgi:DNA invertase Pin-like site-specific DNA recombinase|nr:recombinase family protein [Bifidobacteriaceae bacterium]
MGGSVEGVGSDRRVVLYVRISDDPAGLERGVDRQEQDCRALAEANGWEVVEVFRENDTSAFKQRVITLASGERVRRVVRPGFRAMLGRLAQKGADVMVAYDLDRAVRDPRDLEDLIDAKVLYGFGVRSVTGSLRLDTDADVAMARVLVAMANKSSADTARRVARAKRQSAVEGKWPGGTPPFGYRSAKDTLQVVPEQAALLLEAVDRVLAGDSLYRIRCDWNARGLRSAKGCLWTEHALKCMLRNPATKAVRVYRPVQADGAPAPEPVVETAAVWEPLMDDETWRRVQDVLDARKAARTTWPGSTKRVHVFSGLIRCSRCGTAMRKQGPAYSCVPPTPGACARSIDAREVTELAEEAVLSVFAQIALKPGLGRVQTAGGALDVLGRRLDADRAALEELDDDHYDGLIDKATWARQRARISQRIAARQKDWAARQPEVLVGQGVDMASVADEWEGRTVAWRHAAASLVLEAVLVHAHPGGVAAVIPRRKADTDESYAARLRDHRRRLLAQRVELVWRA